MADDEHHDVVVIGGGPAGVSAALECHDIGLGVVVLEAGTRLGGQLPEIAHSVRNVAAGRFADGEALRAAMEESAALLGDRVRLSHRVTQVDVDDRSVEVDGRRFRCRALLVAGGTRRQFLPAAVDGAFGGDVTYQIESQPGRLAGRRVVVIGGGDSAALDALELAASGSSVTVVHRSPSLTARQDIVDKVVADPRVETVGGWQLEGVRGDDRLQEVILVNPTTDDRRTLAAGGLVVKIARLPSTDLFGGALELDRRGALVVDRELRSSRPGVYAAGDITAGAYARVATAMGQGVLAARSLLRHLQGRP
ncbi:MAG: NAD(P)/FAD-dependent oxidoreductase [Acidimicrobiales bacterium]